MSLANLPTLGEEQQRRRAVQKHDIPTRLDEKTADDKDDAKKLDLWRKAVAFRDRGRCRVCGCQTLVTLELVPRRREIHHIVSRTNPLVRHDVRNGLTTCLEDHKRLTRHKLFVVGTAKQMFQAGRTTK